jgi:hypothetical protein
MCHIKQGRGNTVGAQSINRFFKKNIFLQWYISGHRQDRELWFFFCLGDLDHGYHVDLKKCNKKINRFSSMKV